VRFDIRPSASNFWTRPRAAADPLTAPDRGLRRDVLGGGPDGEVVELANLAGERIAA
jgi:hypothetical protein